MFLSSTLNDGRHIKPTVGVVSLRLLLPQRGERTRYFQFLEKGDIKGKCVESTVEAPPTESSESMMFDVDSFNTASAYATNTRLQLSQHLLNIYPLPFKFPLSDIITLLTRYCASYLSEVALRSHVDSVLPFVLATCSSTLQVLDLKGAVGGDHVAFGHRQTVGEHRVALSAATIEMLLTHSKRGILKVIDLSEDNDLVMEDIGYLRPAYRHTIESIPFPPSYIISCLRSMYPIVLYGCSTMWLSAAKEKLRLLSSSDPNWVLQTHRSCDIIGFNGAGEAYDPLPETALVFGEFTIVDALYMSVLLNRYNINAWLSMCEIIMFWERRIFNGRSRLSMRDGERVMMGVRCLNSRHSLPINNKMDKSMEPFFIPMSSLDCIEAAKRYYTYVPKLPVPWRVHPLGPPLYENMISVPSVGDRLGPISPDKTRDHLFFGCDDPFVLLKEAHHYDGVYRVSSVVLDAITAMIVSSYQLYEAEGFRIGYGVQYRSSYHTQHSAVWESSIFKL
eukprot:Tbor_TRINITY_DN3842_c0_g1::TRINITY_DN3842_c0_g1_i1::g.5632::m.5632